MRTIWFVLALIAAACKPAVVTAQTLPVPQNVVGLTASASVEVPRDWLTVVFTTTREGADAAAVQSQLKQLLDAALTEARKAARPGQLEVQTGAFSLVPRYAPITPRQQSGTPPNVASSIQPGSISGWRGTAELIVEGRDTAAIAQLAGRVQTLSIGRVAYSLSRAAREKVEAEVSAQAIERFRARADAVSRQFGFTGYTVREVNLSADSPPQPMAMMRSSAMASMEDEAPLPTEAGKALVTSTVNGTVQMK